MKLYGASRHRFWSTQNAGVVGTGLGLTVGLKDGLVLGDRDGLELGLALGDTEGLVLGECDGLIDGDTEGLVLGETDGDRDGLALGLTVGICELSQHGWNVTPSCCGLPRKLKKECAAAMVRTQTTTPEMSCKKKGDL